MRGDANDEFAQVVVALAEQEWSDPSSLSSRNQPSIPSEARQGFVVLADMGGVCLLDPSGRLRAFTHPGGEVSIFPEFLRAAARELDQRFPGRFVVSGDGAVLLASVSRSD